MEPKDPAIRWRELGAQVSLLEDRRISDGDNFPAALDDYEVGDLVTFTVWLNG